MTTEILVAAIAAVISVLIYFAGVKRGERLERARQEHERKLQSDHEAHERELELERQRHERELEEERRDQALASKVADEYVSMVRRHYDSGLSAMARLGLESLGTDPLIRLAIEEMRVRTSTDPWSGQAGHVEDLDLAIFFRHVRERGKRFSNTTVENVANEVRQAGGVKHAA